MSRFEASFYEITELGAGQPETRAGCFMCCHCGAHRPFTPGQKQNGYCMNCDGYVCGPTCSGECKPLERWLEEQEGTRDPTAVKVAVPESKLWVPKGT
jgi:hypothetical protein